MKIKFLRKLLALALITMFVLAMFSIMGFRPIGPLVENGPVVIEPVLLTAAMLATFLLELVKYLIRRVVVDQPSFDFPPIFYETGVPLAVFLVQILFGKIKWGPMPDFTVSYLLNWIVGVVVALASYYMTVKPLKVYRKAYMRKRNKPAA